MERRKIAAVIGSARASGEEEEIAATVARAAIGGGFRIITGGLGGIMRAASKGARSAFTYKSGDVIGVLPTYDATTANEFVDVPICTGLNHARNLVVVATADVVFVVGGRSGTLSEIAHAWQLGKPIIVVGDGHGWGKRMGGERIDDRREDVVHGPMPPADAVALATRLASSPSIPPKSF